MKKYWYWLCSMEKIGNRTKEVLLQKFQTPEGIYFATKKDFMQIKGISEKMVEYFQNSKNKDWEKEYEEMKQKGISFVMHEEKEYPERLKKIVDKPYGLYYMGGLPKEEMLSVAIIGARDCSRYS